MNLLKFLIIIMVFFSCDKSHDPEVQPIEVQEKVKSPVSIPSCHVILEIFQDQKILQYSFCDEVYRLEATGSYVTTDQVQFTGPHFNFTVDWEDKIVYLNRKYDYIFLEDRPMHLAIMDLEYGEAELIYSSPYSITFHPSIGFFVSTSNSSESIFCSFDITKEF